MELIKSLITAVHILVILFCVFFICTIGAIDLNGWIPKLGALILKFGHLIILTTIISSYKPRYNRILVMIIGLVAYFLLIKVGKIMLPF
jgi:hypothetical protein